MAHIFYVDIHCNISIFGFMKNWLLRKNYREILGIEMIDTNLLLLFESGGWLVRKIYGWVANN